MCNPASFVLTQENAYWSKTSDRHSDIISENKLREGLASKVMILACEITPPIKDGQHQWSAPQSEWKYRVDDAYPIPDWYDAARDEARARIALQSWVAEKIVLQPVSEIKAGFKLAVCANVSVVSGGSIANVSGGSIDNVWGGSIANVSGGTVTTFSASIVATLKAVLKGTVCVLIDRSGAAPVCTVGEQAPAKKPKKPKKASTK
jgi:hypothetical protein